MSASSGYQLVQNLGTGVCGAVYLAEIGSRKVAIRQFVSTAPFDSPAWHAERQYFLDAGRRAMDLKHPRIVPILEVVDERQVNAEGEAFLAIEYMEAETLRSAMATRSFSPQEAGDLLRQVAMALDYAHQHGIVHGDLKPGDIFLDRRGAVVSDFGISLRAHLDAAMPIPPALLHPFLSPEHIRNPKSVDARSDQFALATIAYVLYTGHSPYGAGVADLGGAILNSQVLPPSRANCQVPPEIDGPVMRSLSPDPSQRFGSCMEFVASLGAAMITQADEGAGGKSHRWLYAATAVVILAGAGGAYYRWWRTPAPEPAAKERVNPPAKPDLPAPALTPTLTPTPRATPVQRSTPAHQSGPGGSPFGGYVAPLERPRPTPAPQVPVNVSATKVKPGACPTLTPAESNITLQVFSELTKEIREGEVFRIDDPKLGRMAYGDLSAVVNSNLPLTGKLTMEWKIKGETWDVVPMAAQTDQVVFRNKPIAGEYDVYFKRNGCQLSTFHFRITEP